MIADLEYPPPSPPDVPRRRSTIALHWSMAILAVSVGVVGLFGDSGPKWLQLPWLNVQALFGLLLASLVIARFHGRVKYGPPLLAADIKTLSRHLSRMVYLLLYLTIGIKQLIALASFVAHGGGFDFGLFQVASNRGVFEPTAEFQAFLVYGLLALIIIRMLAAATWLRSTDRRPMTDASRAADGTAAGQLHR